MRSRLLAGALASSRCSPRSARSPACWAVGWTFAEALEAFVVSNILIGVSFGLCGALIAWHRPSSAARLDVRRRRRLPGGCRRSPRRWPSCSTTAVPPHGSCGSTPPCSSGPGRSTSRCIPLSLLLLPDGRLASRRWRPVAHRRRGHRAAVRARGRARPGAPTGPAAGVPDPERGHVRLPGLALDAERGALGALGAGRRGLPGGPLPRGHRGGAPAAALAGRRRRRDHRRRHAVGAGRRHADHRALHDPAAAGGGGRGGPASPAARHPAGRRPRASPTRCSPASCSRRTPGWSSCSPASRRRCWSPCSPCPCAPGCRPRSTGCSTASAATRSRWRPASAARSAPVCPRRSRRSGWRCGCPTSGVVGRRDAAGGRWRAGRAVGRRCPSREARWSSACAGARRRLAPADARLLGLLSGPLSTAVHATTLLERAAGLPGTARRRRARRSGAGSAASCTTGSGRCSPEWRCPPTPPPTWPRGGRRTPRSRRQLSRGSRSDTPVRDPGGTPDRRQPGLTRPRRARPRRGAAHPRGPGQPGGPTAPPCATVVEAERAAAAAARGRAGGLPDRHRGADQRGPALSRDVGRGAARRRTRPACAARCSTTAAARQLASGRGHRRDAGAGRPSWAARCEVGSGPRWRRGAGVSPDGAARDPRAGRRRPSRRPLRPGRRPRPRSAGFEVVAVAADGREAVREAVLHRPGRRPDGPADAGHRRLHGHSRAGPCGAVRAGLRADDVRRRRLALRRDAGRRPAATCSRAPSRKRSPARSVPSRPAR